MSMIEFATLLGMMPNPQEATIFDILMTNA